MTRLLRASLAALALFAALAPARAQLPPSGALIVNQTQIQGGSASQCLFINSATTPNTVGAQACGGSGTVTSVSVVTANGVSGSVATATTTPAITLTLGAITPTSVNGNTITTGTGALTLGSVTLNAGAGGTLGSNAFTSTAYLPLTGGTLTGALLFSADNTIDIGSSGATRPRTGYFGTSVTSPLVLGGSGTTQAVTYRTTSGVGAAGADHVFQVGNNGATQALRVFNSGAVAIGGNSDGARVGQLSVAGLNPVVAVASTTDGVANAAATLIINSTSAVTAGILANEPGRTTVRWGLTIGNWAEVVDFGTNGMIVGENSNAPLVFGTNNAERARVSAAGCFGIGTTTDCGAANMLVAGHLLASGTAPTISSCGSSPSVSGSDNFGTVTAGGGVLSSCVINFGKTWGATPRCAVSSGTAIASMTVTTSTQQLTIGGTSLTGDVINWVCGATASLVPANGDAGGWASPRAA